MTSSPIDDPLNANGRHSSSELTARASRESSDGPSSSDARPPAVGPGPTIAPPNAGSVASPVLSPLSTSIDCSRSTLAAPPLSRSASNLETNTSSVDLTSISTSTYTLITQAFAPHVSVLASSDCQELVRHKGLHGGLLELLRPYGERVLGRVVIRDSNGASRPWDNFGVRFVGPRDGIEPPRRTQRERATSTGSAATDGTGGADVEFRPARLRSGGDVQQIEQLVEQSLDHPQGDGDLDDGVIDHDHGARKPFRLYQHALLSGTTLCPHETFAHPVTLVIAISSRNPSPIEELRDLYAKSNTGEHRLPVWVNNEFLRYYVLVHDEEYDDIKKSTTLFEQMKRHFGLHCHLLRLRSRQCSADDEQAAAMPKTQWASAGERLADMGAESEDDPPPSSASHIFSTDETAVRSFVREMVTQSVIPSMERMVTTWNDQVASRRRGLSGRFMSLSKRFTPFGSRSGSPSGTTSGSNYDNAGGFYRPEAPEAVMRKLADYAMMLRDYSLARSTYEILCGDFKNDKAWRYYAGANEMTALTTLMTKIPGSGSGGGASSNSAGSASAALSASKRAELVEQYIENAYYNYSSRFNTPFYALRTVFVAADLLAPLDITAGDLSLSADHLPSAVARNAFSTNTAAAAAARWYTRVLDDRDVGVVGHALLCHTIAECYASTARDVEVSTTHKTETTVTSSSEAMAAKHAPFMQPTRRARKAALWYTLAATAWLELDRLPQATACVGRAVALYAPFLDLAGSPASVRDGLGSAGSEGDIEAEIVRLDDGHHDDHDHDKPARETQVEPGSSEGLDPLSAPLGGETEVETAATTTRREGLAGPPDAGPGSGVVSRNEDDEGFEQTALVGFGAMKAYLGRLQESVG